MLENCETERFFRPCPLIMAAAYREKVDLLCCVWKEDIFPSLVEVIRKATEDGNEMEDVKALMWRRLNTLFAVWWRSALVVADHLASGEETEKLNIPKSLVQEARAYDTTS